MLDPTTQYNVNSSIFAMPIYITPNGQVTNDTIKQRIDKYFLPFNFSCMFYNPSINNFNSNGMVYYNFSSNYYNCKSTHLTSFKVDYFQILPSFKTLGRFYYITHIELLFYFGNYLENYGLLIIMFILGIYLIVVIFYSICENYKKERLVLLDYLKKEIIKINIPYSRDYNYNLNIQFQSENIARINIGSKQVKNHNNKEGATINDPDNSNNRNNLNLEEFKTPDYDVVILNDNNFIDKELKKYAHSTNRTNNKSVISLMGTNEKEQILGPPKENEYPPSNYEKIEKKDDKLKSEINLNDQTNKILNPNYNKLEEQDERQIDSKLRETFNKNLTIPSQNDIISMSDKLFSFPSHPVDKEKIKINNFILKKIQKGRPSDINEGKDNVEDGSSKPLPTLDEEFDEDACYTEFSNLDLTFWEFFRRNLNERHTIFSNFCNVSIIYGRSKKIGNLCITLFLKMLILVIFFTIDEDMNLVNLL